MKGTILTTLIGCCPLENQSGEFVWVLLNGDVASYLQLPVVTNKREEWEGF